MEISQDFVTAPMTSVVHIIENLLKRAQTFHGMDYVTPTQIAM